MQLRLDEVVQLRDAPVDQIDSLTLYRLLALRVDVFVVEQSCPYRELDGRDIEPQARLFWAEAGGRPLATLRLLDEADGSARIGRVATAAAARSGGLAGQLMQRSLDHLGAARDVVLDAQAQLADWYARFGFVRDGADFNEDGIRHVPMRRPATG